MASNHFKALVKNKFDARTDYDRNNDRHPKLAAELVDRSRLQKGWNVLDVACGTGLATYPAAEAVGPNGSVTGIDLSPGLIKQAKAKLGSSAFSNVTFIVGDLELAHFPNQAFDAILCSQAIFYFDMTRVPHQLHSWLRTGGLLAYNTLQAPFTPLLPLLRQLLQEAGHGSPAAPFESTGTAEANVHSLEAAGFTNVQVHETPGLLLEKPVLLEDYVEQGCQMALVAFKPFFPGLLDLSDTEQAILQHKFTAQADDLGRNMLNADGLVEDRHTTLWVTAQAR